MNLKTTCSSCGKAVRQSKVGALGSWFSRSCSCRTQQNPVAEDVIVETTEEKPEDVTFPDLGPDYEVLEFLGAGGMGQVFKVLDKRTSHNVAIKIMRNGLHTDRESVRRFENEASAVVGLDHQGIVSVLGHGTALDGAPYLVMSCAEGMSLAKYLKARKKIAESEAIDVFIEIADALAYAHKAGIVHRDLKPSNVIAKLEDGKLQDVRLVDFGIAKAMSQSMTRDTQNLTKTGEVFGSPAYMSPEQCLGFKLDQRSDIYSFGCLMYEAISGATPFAAENPVRMVVKQIGERPEPWSKTKDGRALVGLEAVVFRCLEKEKEERYQTMDALLKDLRQLKAGKKVAKLERIQIAKPALTPHQGLVLIVSFCLLFLYWTTLLGAAPVAMLPAALSVVAIPIFVQHLRKFGLDGNNWERWELLSKGIAAALCLSAILVCVVIFGPVESQPQSVQFVFAGLILLQLYLTILAIASKVVVFLMYGSKRMEWRRMFAQLALLAVPAMVLCTTGIPGVLPNYVPNGLIDSFKVLTERPNLLRALSIVTLKLDDDNVQALSSLSGSAIKSNRSENWALPLVDKAIKKIPPIASGSSYFGERTKYGDLMAAHAGLCQVAGDWKQAYADLDNAIAKSKSNSQIAQLYQQRGELDFSLGRFEDAVQDFSKSVEQDLSRRNVQTNQGLAQSYFRLKKFKNAAAAMEPEGSWSFYYGSLDHLKRAILFEYAGDKKEAMDEYREAVKLSDQNHAGPLQYIAILATNELKGEDHLMKAYAYLKLGDSAKSTAELARAHACGVDKTKLLDEFVKKLDIKLDW